MRPFHLLVHDVHAREPRRVNFSAESPDHAFQVARNESEGVRVELWDGATLLASMTKAGAGMWQLLPLSREPEQASIMAGREAPTATASEAGPVY